MKTTSQLAISAITLGLLVACATPAPTPSGLTPTTVPTIRLAPSLTPTVDAPLDADANNPPDTPDFHVTVTQVGPPRWIYALRYTGNFVLTAPGILPRTDFTELNIHGTHDISKVAIQVLSETPSRVSSGTPTPVSPGYKIIHCWSMRIHIASKEAPTRGWDKLIIAIDGDYANNVIYFGFNKSCGSDPLAASPHAGWAGPLVGP